MASAPTTTAPGTVLALSNKLMILSNSTIKYFSLIEMFRLNPYIELAVVFFSGGSQGTKYVELSENNRNLHFAHFCFACTTCRLIL
jgi:hypothetical protein